MRLLFRTLNFMLLVFLAGCMSTNTARQDTPLNTAEGLMVLHVVDNGTDRFWKWDKVTLIRTDKPMAPIMIEDSGGGLYHSSAVFMQNLPIGHYRLDSISAVRKPAVGDIAEKTENKVVLKEQAATFEITGATIVDLGTLVVSQDKAIEHIESQFFREHLATHYPTMKGSAKLTVASPVTKRSVPMASVKPTLSLNPPTRDQDGTMYFGSRLGRVLVRNLKGTWRVIQTPTVAEVRQLTVSGKKWLVVAEDILFLSNDAGKTWRPVELPADAGKAEFANFINGELHVATSHPAIGNLADFSVYRMTKEQWVRVAEKRFPHAGMFNFGGTDFQLETYLWDQATSTVVIGSYDPSRKKLDGTWALLRNPKRMPVSGTVHGVGISATLMSSKAAFIVVGNDGKLTERYLFSPPNIMLDSVFENETNGFALMAKMARTEPDKGSGEFLMLTRDIRLMETHDGGYTWIAVSNLIEGGAERLFLANGNVLLLISRNGTVSASRDMGRTWRVERRTL